MRIIQIFIIFLLGYLIRKIYLKSQNDLSKKIHEKPTKQSDSKIIDADYKVVDKD